MFNQQTLHTSDAAHSGASASADRQRQDDDITKVELTMLSAAAGDRLDRLGLIVAEHLDSGGKRLRARLALAACDALGVDRSDAIVWAAACEMMHNATLVHDDLQDGDRVRRGRPTTWATHGAAQAVNAGDLMLMIPFSVLERMCAPHDVRWRLALEIARQAESTVRGQANELDLKQSGRLDWDSYHRAARGKTAGLLALPVSGAAILAGRDDDADWLAEHFGDIGLLFQLQDDLVDLYGDKGRGEVGSDLREGKISALVVEHLRKAPDDRSWLLDVLAADRDATSVADIERAVVRFRESGAVDAIVQRIVTIADRVARCPRLGELPALHEAAVRLVGLSLAPIRHLLSEPTAPRRADSLKLGLVALAGI